MTIGPGAHEDDVPSYARPTKASETRRIWSSTDDMKAAAPKNHKLKKLTVACLSFSSPTPRRYSLTTASWRSKARFPGPFRLLDLPPELRNRIYEHIEFKDRDRLVDLWHTKSQDLLKTLPPILATSRQLLQEAGSYFFGEGDFTCMISGYGTKRLAAWVKLIGRANFNSLKKLDIRFALTSSDAMPHEHGWPGISRVLSFADTAELVGMLDTFDSLASQYPLLRRTRFSAQQNRDLLGFEFPIIREPWQLDSQENGETVMPFSSFDRLGRAVRRLLELIGDVNVETQVADAKGVILSWDTRRVGKWAVTDELLFPNEQTLNVTARSGRRIYTDLDARSLLDR